MRVMQKLINRCTLIFESYLFINIKTYKNQTTFHIAIEHNGDIKMKLITLHLPEPYIQALDNLVDEKFYPNRAEAIRTAVRDLLSIEAWGKHRNG
jgi:antitoxin ParD1/3/4